jgi:uncharacterized membrane protein YidH (DUF202 family)
MRLALAFILVCSACAHTRPLTPPPAVCARVTSRHTGSSRFGGPAVYLLGKHSVDHGVFEAELSRFADARLARARERALFASGWTSIGLGMSVFAFGIWPATASGHDRAVYAVGGTWVALTVSGIVMAGVSRTFEAHAVARYNAQIGDRCPQPALEYFDP